MTHVLLPARAARDTTLSALQLRMLAYLGSQADQPGGVTRTLSSPEIMEAVGCGYTRTSATITSLIKQGYVRREETGVYQVDFGPDEATSEALQRESAPAAVCDDIATHGPSTAEHEPAWLNALSPEQRERLEQAFAVAAPSWPSLSGDMRAAIAKRFGLAADDIGEALRTGDLGSEYGRCRAAEMFGLS